MKATQQVVAAVPQLASYQGYSGIQRVFQNIRAHWSQHVQIVSATFVAYPLPILRNFPCGIRAPSHANIILLPQLTGAQALRKTNGLPSLVIIHDIGVVDFPGDRIGMDWLTYQSILRSFWSIRHASRIITVSQWTRSRVLHYLPELADRVQVIPNGVDPAFLHYASTQAAAQARIVQATGHQLRAPLLLYVGSEIPRKNIALLLEVFHRVKQTYPTAQLLKVGGPGHMRWRDQTLQHARRLGLQPGVDLLLLDRVADTTLADLYRAADLFVSASSYEGFGLPLLEAMAVGTPTVVTNCGAFREIVNDTGWLVAPEVEPFARAIDTALNVADAEWHAQAAKNRAKQFTWEHAAQQYIDAMTTMTNSLAA